MTKGPCLVPIDLNVARSQVQFYPVEGCEEESKDLGITPDIKQVCGRKSPAQSRTFLSYSHISIAPSLKCIEAADESRTSSTKPRQYNGI